MNFHKREYLVQAVLKRIVAENPELADDIAALQNHYMNTLPKPQPSYLAAMATLLAAPNVREAANQVSSSLQVTHLLAESYMREGINAGPDFLKAREAYLHNKGVIRGRDRYFISTRTIAPDTIYDRAWQMADAAKREILADAVQAHMPIRGKTLDHAAFNYVAALLIPAGQERDFALNKLSLTHKRAHDTMVREAVGYIRDTARERGVYAPSDLPSAAHMPLAPVPAPLPSPHPHDAAASPKRLGAALKAKAAEIIVPSDPAGAKMDGDASSPESSHVLRDRDAIKQLKRDLDVLKTQRVIGEKEARLYLWLHTEGKNGERTVSDAAEVLNKPENVVRIMVAQVGRALNTLRSAEDLQGQGHQSRPVGP